MCKKSKREDTWTENKVIKETILTTNQTQENEVHKWNSITRVIQLMLWVCCYWLWNHEHKIVEMNSLWAKLTTHELMNTGERERWKTWDAFAFSPALAIATIPTLSCFNFGWNSSSKHLACSPYKNLQIKVTTQKHVLQMHNLKKSSNSTGQFQALPACGNS